VNPEPSSLLRLIPKTDRVLLEPRVAALVESGGREVVVRAVREATDALRARVQAGDSGQPEPEALLERVVADVERRVAGASVRSLRRAINATGVILHTGLGRAVLSAAAVEAMTEAASGHALLEVDAETGERGSRLAHVSGLLRELTGAEDGLVVNNNAAAVLLAISALAAGREVVIARGQLVEIGGYFRIPDVIRSGGARLVEVGTTNKVRIRDYAEAIGPETALLLRVHPSNFKIVGFTEEPSLAEMSALGRERCIPLMDDLGSGALVDLSAYGVAGEPTVRDSVRAGGDLVWFSGDKLLGGPQAGLVVGREDLLARLRKHPLMRVVRGDKITLAGIEATLRLYRDAPRALWEIPTLAAITATEAVLRERAEKLAGLLKGEGLDVRVEPGASQVGGGSLPGEELPTWLVSLRAEGVSTGEFARRLRTGTPSVWGRVQRDRLVLDPRTVTDDEIVEIGAAVSTALRIEADGTGSDGATDRNGQVRRLSE
jgi:L-seryl-tRNA(Ser) seleniumtransferase